jgi:FAD/FMN-containing dehydrogenase
MSDEVRNWAGNEAWEPARVEHPTGLDDLVRLVRRAEAEGLTVKACGPRHSFSRAAATDGVQVDTRKMGRILAVSREEMTIEVEAGIRLAQLYEELAKHDLALPSIPNTDQITLGGAIANGTHGTNLHHGTYSSMVLELVLVGSGGTVHRLRRDASDPRQREHFEAAIVSVGMLGVVYSIKLQLCENYDMLVQRMTLPLADVRGRIAEMATARDAVQFMLFPHEEIAMLKVQTKIPRGAHRRTRSNMTNVSGFGLLVWALNPQRPRFVGRLLQRLSSRSWFNRAIRAGHECVAVTSWCDGELSHHKSRFMNMEYALTMDAIEDAVSAIFRIAHRHRACGTYQRSLPIILRPVGEDKMGFLSTAYRRKTCYVDMLFQALDECETNFYREVESALLAHGGRVSWSRKFFASGAEVLAAFPKAGAFRAVRDELDPRGTFSSDFAERVFGGRTADVRLARRDPRRTECFGSAAPSGTRQPSARVIA